MKKILLLIVFGYSVLPLVAQHGNDTIKLSELFSAKEIGIYQPEFILNPAATIYDTIKLSFVLINDIKIDTTIYCDEGPNDWQLFSAMPMHTYDTPIQQVSGRNFYGKMFYDDVYFPAQKIRLQANAVYKCLVQWKANSYAGVNKGGGLMAADYYFSQIKLLNKSRYTNNIITFFFTGAIFFGFFLFLFLYFKSRYPLFGMYALFLFLQGIYGFILFDVYTLAGSIFLTHFNWDEYVTELVVFLGQAIYVQFIIGWLQMKLVSTRLAKKFNGISIFFAVYAVTFFVMYKIAPGLPLLYYMKAGVRILGLLFQFFLFYHIFFTLKTPGRWYIFNGNLLLMLLGIIMIFLRSKGLLLHTWVADIDNASWYMLGVLGENLCFTMGIGQHYFELQNEKNKMQVAALHARQQQLEMQENNLKDRIRISQDLHDSIGSTLSSISVYSQVAKIHDENNEHEDLQELLGKISTTSNEMVGEMNDIVWAINPGNDNMEKIIQRMESFAMPLAAARSIQFKLSYAKAVALVQLDMDMRKNFYLIFKECVNNAIKYSGAKNIDAVIRLPGGMLQLEVTDNGVGFNPEVEMAYQSTSLSGNGLKNMQYRTARLNGVFAIKSVPGSGTTITCTLPL